MELLSKELVEQIKPLKKELEIYRMKNAKKDLYYESKNELKDLGISVPDTLRKMRASVAFCQVVVDKYSARVKLQGFYGAESSELDKIFKANRLAQVAKMVTKDAIKYGTGYIIVGRGDTSIGEPKVIISAESPNNVFASRNLRTGRASAAIQLIKGKKEKESLGTLFLLDRIVPFMILEDGRYVLDGEIQVHNENFIPVFQLINDPVSSSTRGRSEITDHLMNLQDEGVRAMASLALNREYYGRPQAIFTNVDGKEFENGRNPFSSQYGKAIIFGQGANRGANQGGTIPSTPPSVTQLQVGSPQPHIDELKFLRTEVSMASGIPTVEFALDTANPASADAINAGSHDIVSKSEDLISNEAEMFEQLMTYAVRLWTGEEPEEDIQALYGEPSTPTAAAIADATSKYVAAGSLSPTSPIVYNRMNLSKQEREMLARENKEAKTLSLIENLAKAKGPLPENDVN